MPPKKTESDVIMHCLKCKQKRPVHDVQEATTKNGRKMIKAKCNECETRVCKFIKG